MVDFLNTSDVGSEFDVTNLDQSLQSMSAVEQTWRAPKLPDEVKLDLAMMPEIEDTGAFLSGLERDLHGEGEDMAVQEDEPAPPQQQAPNDPTFNRSGYDLARVVFADLANEPAPTDPTVDAVSLFKQRAIDRGLLADTGGTPDNTWSPELNSIRYEMAFSDYDKALRGDRYGAVDAHSLVNILADWTQPSSLLAAATELDLFWDFGAVSKEWTTWGDKFRKIKDSDNPWEWGKSVVDAVTGPIDDVVMPIVNWALIASGVGAATATAKGGMFAGRLGSMEGLLRIPNLRAVKNLSELSEASWTATKLGKSSSSALRGVGTAMEAWRGWTPVARTKGVVQAGMRLGFASQAEDLLPGYQGGIDLAGTPEDPSAIGRGAARLKAVGQSPIFMPFELAVAPYNIFAPGTFIGKEGAISRTASGLFTVAGTAPGRAVAGGVVGAGVGTLLGDDTGDIIEGAVIGAAGAAAAPALGRGLNWANGKGGTYLARAGGTIDEAMEATWLGQKFSPFSWTQERADGLSKTVGHVSDFLEHSSFKPITDDQRTATMFDRVMRRSLQGDDLKRYEDAWRSKGTLSGAVGEWAGLDDEAGAGVVTWMMMTAAIDNIANAAAHAPAAGSVDNRFYAFRNKLVNQLRVFDTNNITQYRVEELARAAASSKMGNADPAAFLHQYEVYRDSMLADPSRILEIANTHNAIASQTVKDLLAGVTEEALASHVPQALESFGRWDAFTSSTAQVDDAFRSGLLDPAEFLPRINRRGNLSKAAKGEMPTASSTSIMNDAITDEVIIGATSDLTKTTTSKNLSVLAQQSPSGKVTVAKIGTAANHDLMTASEQLKGLQEVLEGVQAAKAHGFNWNALQDAAGMPLTDLSRNQLKAAVLASQGGSTKFTNTADNLIAMAKRQGVDPMDLLATIDGHVDEVLGNSEYWDTLGLGLTVRSNEGEMLTGAKALKARIKELDHKARYTASEIDVDALVAHYESAGDAASAAAVRELADGLEVDGYKLVHGKEFMMPHDVSENFQPFKDLTTRHLHAETLGNAFRGRVPAEGRMIEDRLHRTALAVQLSKQSGKDLNVHSKEVDEMLTDLKQILSRMHEDGNALVDNMWQENWLRKRITAVSTSSTPLRVDDMLQKKNEVIEGLVSVGHSREAATAAWESIPAMRNAQFKDMGLYAIEAYLRSHNQAAGALKFVTGGKGGGLINGRNVAMATGAYVGQQMGADYGPETEDGNLGARLVGGALGAVAGYAGARGATAAATKEFGAAGQSLIRRAELNRMGYMADNLVRVRDMMRFTLSPFFDISRYTEGLMLAQTAAPLRNADGTRMALHLNMSPTSLRNRHIKDALGHLSPADARRASHEWFDNERQVFRAAAKGDFDPDVLDSTGKWFSQIGIMGFNPTDWMASAFTELRMNGLGSEQAYEAVRSMYTYGTKGRSAVELSTNFVFFPFSFQKKAMTHIAKWMNDDLGRSIMIADAFKTYEILDEKYDLNTYWRDHAPMLDQLNKLNLFAYGLSPGRLGGINRPFVEAGYKAALGLFVPGGMSIRNAADQAELTKVVRSLTPALNDINWMTKNVQEQYNVVKPGGSGVTIRAEVRQGYDEWNLIQEDFGKQLDRLGASWSDLSTKPHLASLNAAYQSQRAQLARTHPAWFRSRQESTGNRVALEMEKTDRLARAVAGGAATSQDMMLYSMETQLAEMRKQAAYRGMKVGGNEGWEDAPPSIFTTVHRIAAGMLEQDPEFNSIWEKYYTKDFGPLEAQI